MMRPIESRVVVFALATAIALFVQVGIEGVDVNVEHDKSFDFRPVKTWGWNPEGPGDLRMARTQDDDPAAVKKRFEPTILDAVTTEMMRRGLTQAPSAPDVTVTYFVLLSTNMSTQTLGQFLPATTAWALPPFGAATQSMTVMNQGSLVLDLSAKGAVVWRGVAQAKVDLGVDDKKREALLREAVRDLLRRYPPKR
jgi:hypothetical protein